jgi:hypothetical protein
MCFAGIFVSAAIKGFLHLEAYLETIQYTKECLRREPSNLSYFSVQPRSKRNVVEVADITLATHTASQHHYILTLAQHNETCGVN